MRILIITRNLPPLVGGMERLHWHMSSELAKHADVHLIGPAGSAEYTPCGVSMQEAPLKPVWYFLSKAQYFARRVAKHWQPDIILAASGLTAPLALITSHYCDARTAVCLHGLDIAVAHRIYKMLWLAAIRRMDRVVAISRATERLAVDAGVDRERINIIHPGVSLPAEEFNKQAASRFRTHHGFEDRPILLSVGRLTPRKGLLEFVRDVLPRVASKKPDVLLVVIGDLPIDALHAKRQNPQNIQAVADAAGVGRHLRFLGRVDDNELMAAYWAANVHVFPIQPIADDLEGFGMVAIEAAAHCLPTVAYAVGGVVDAVAEGKSGKLIEPGDYKSFAEATIRLLDQPLSRAGLRSHAEQFSWQHFGEALTTLMSNELRSVKPRHG